MIELGELLRVVFRRLRLLLPAMLFTFGIALAYILLTPVRYTAVMSIMIDPRERSPVGYDAQPVPQTPDSALIESQMRLLTSQPVLKQVVEKENLTVEPAKSRFGAVFKAFKLLLGQDSGSVSPTEAAIASLEKSISMKRDERSYVVEVAVKGETREKAVKIAQALADAFLAAQARLSDDIIDRQTKWLDLKVRDLRGRVADAERRVQEFREKEQIAITDGRSSFEAQLKDANTALIAAQGRRAELEARYAQIKAGGVAAAEGGASNEWLRSPVIERLRAEYATLSRDEAYARSELGPLHPNYRTVTKQLEAIRTQIQAEQQRIGSATARDLAAARKAESEAAKLVSNLESSNNKLGEKRLELNKLEREAVSVRASYEKTLLARENVRKDVVASPLALLFDPPTALPSPTSPKTIPALLIAFAAGLNIWVGSALLAERNRRRSALVAPHERASGGFTWRKSQTSRAQSSPFTVTAPDLRDEIPSGSGGRSRWRSSVGLKALDRIMREGGAYSGAFSALLDRLTDALDDKTRDIILCVASGAPQAGASTVILSLAYAAADRGAKVLIIDRNYEKPDLTTLARNARPLWLNGLQQLAGVLWRDEESGGAIVVTPAVGEARPSEVPSAEEEFDLTLIDCGRLSSATRLLRQSAPIDGLLVVERRDADMDRLTDYLAREGLDETCVGIVLSGPLREEAR